MVRSFSFLVFLILGCWIIYFSSTVDAELQPVQSGKSLQSPFSSKQSSGQPDKTFQSSGQSSGQLGKSSSHSKKSRKSSGKLSDQSIRTPGEYARSSKLAHSSGQSSVRQAQSSNKSVPSLIKTTKSSKSSVKSSGQSIQSSDGSSQTTGGNAHQHQELSGQSGKVSGPFTQSSGQVVQSSGQSQQAAGQYVYSSGLSGQYNQLTGQRQSGQAPGKSTGKNSRRGKSAESAKMEENQLKLEKKLDLLDTDLKIALNNHQLLSEEVSNKVNRNMELEEQVKRLKLQLAKRRKNQQDLLMKVNELETAVQQHEKYSSSLSRQDEGQETENVWTKSEFYRTCAELRATDRSIPSGMQWIDPDGLGVGENRIHVYCDMSTGSTSILHDSESPIKVSYCAEPGCYSRSIIYQATMAQIKALTDLSSECHQSITYDCFLAPYKVGNTVYSWWNDRDGNSQYFWSGNANGMYTCQCGIDGNCVDSSFTCNCDSLATRQLTDRGAIRDKNILPITRLNFGLTKSLTSYGIHKLGRLTCSGFSRSRRNIPEHSLKPPGQVDGTAIAKLPTSCGDVKKMGYTQSGFFFIKGPKMMESVYCNFTKFSTDADFQKFIGYIDGKSAPTYFYVQRNKKFAEINTPITFNFALVNAGNAISLSSGKFKAPVKGTYFFSFAGLAFSPGCTKTCSSSFNVVKNDFGLQISLYLNGERIGLGSVQDSNVHVATNQWSPVTLTSTLNLKKGDIVWVQISYLSSGAYLHDDNFHHTHFTGYILREEIVDSL